MVANTIATTKLKVTISPSRPPRYLLSKPLAGAIERFVIQPKWASDFDCATKIGWKPSAEGNQEKISEAETALMAMHYGLRFDFEEVFIGDVFHFPKKFVIFSWVGLFSC
jgi:hypothetical protein